MNKEAADYVGAQLPLEYNPMSRTGIIGERPEPTGKGRIVVATGGTSDIPVAEEAAVTADPEKAKKYATLLYDQALLIAGLPLEDPSGYTDLVCELMK